MTTYIVTLADGQVFLMSANLAEASASLKANFGPDEEDEDSLWQVSPFQTADARHSPMRAAELLAEYFKASADDCTDVQSVEAR